MPRLGPPAGRAFLWLAAALFLSAPSSLRAAELSDWYAYSPPPDPSAVPLDLSFLNDGPAGSHGFVQVKDGRFFFTDGTRARFWGANFEGSDVFLPHDKADAAALRLSRLGVNMIRLHMADTGWLKSNFFDPKADNTLELDPAQVERFDYLVSALKKNGVYLYMDWLVLRKYRKGDGVAAYQELDYGAKGVVHFDPRIIELNKLYAKEILDHPNPYTGLALKDDPVYVASEIVNESSLFCNYGLQKFPQYYWDELQKLYAAWGGPGALTRFKYDGAEHRLAPVLNPENASESLKFFFYQTTKTNREMKNFLSQLSPHALLAGSNMGLGVLANVKSDSELDFMDTHGYWDYPQVADGNWKKVLWDPILNLSQLMFQNGSLVVTVCKDAVLGKPLIVTEWNESFPNQYILEGPILMAAYGSLQDWDGLLQFEYGAADLPGTVPMDTFHINKQPANDPVFQAAALIFRKRLLKPSALAIVEKFTDEQAVDAELKNSWLSEHFWLPYAARVVKQFTGSRAEPPENFASADSLYDPVSKVIHSSTGEETLDYGKGILKIESPAVQGFTGAIGTGENFQTADVSLRLSKRNPWASVLALSLDGKPLNQSGKFVVAAVARAMNSGQVFNEAGKALTDPGGVPILMQGVKGDLEIRSQWDSLTIRPLDESGKAGRNLPARRENGLWKFSLSPSDHTAYYLAVSPGK